MKTTDLAGLTVPPTTPFDENNRVDHGPLSTHLEFLAAEGVSRLLISGTTAEFFSLLPEERISLLKTARRAFSGRLFFNTASDSLLQALELAKRAEGEGADAVVAMAPYYYAGALEEGLVRFFNELGAATALPLVLYNFARHTGNPLTPSILERVSHVAVKDSSGDFSLMSHTPCYLSGTSRKMVEGARVGAAGFVSSLANIYPRQYVNLERLLAAGDFAGAEAVQSEIIDLCREIPSGNEIGAIKSCIAGVVKGYPDRVRLPLV